MIQFDLNFTYEDGDTPALQNAEGRVTPGRCVVLCGDSGCGKTTLLRCLNHLIPEFYEGELRGFCRLNGEDTAQMSIGEVGELAVSVFQDPRSQFFTINSSTEVAFGPENFGIPQQEIVSRVDAAFSLFGLERLKDRNVYELSSGERQLVSILSAWAARTDILLLDEPTANLDYAAVQQLASLLQALMAQGKTMVISEHRLHYLTGIADEYWLMKDGTVARKFSPEEMARLTEEELSALSLRTTDLQKISPALPVPITPPVQHNLEVRDLRFRYQRSSDELLRGISLDAGSGQVIGLIGANGCGKTTFGKLLTGLYAPTGGQILLDGQPVSQKQLTSQALFIMQETEFQFFTNSVLAELKYGLEDAPALDDRIERLLVSCGMDKYRDRHPFSLSGGQQQRLALMVACLSRKPIVVLDEPTAGLDKSSLNSCIDLIREMQQEKLVFIITHDLELLSKVCTSAQCIAGGKLARSFDLRQEQQFREMVQYMADTFPLPRSSPRKLDKPHLGHVDVRTKLLIFILPLLFSVSHSTGLVVSTTVVGVLLTVLEGYYRSSVLGLLSLGLIYSGVVFPQNIFAFFIPRMILPFLYLETIISKNESSATLAAMRKLHVPETVIMVVSVVLRFFPVLSNDMKLLHQSIKTRGAFIGFAQKLQHLPDYLEIYVVPMALRVIKIAETLSASAETRGIALKRKRSSYIALHFTFWDALFVCITLCSIWLGLALPI